MHFANSTNLVSKANDFKVDIMKTMHRTIAIAVSLWALTISLAFAEVTPVEDPLADFNFNIGVEEQVIPDSVDIELVSRICANDLDKHVCLGERLQQAIERY